MSSSRYQLLPSLLIGFHGTDANTAERVLAGEIQLSPSVNDYDWLGHGIYFWEYSPLRAYQFVVEKLKWKRRTEPVAVVGAIVAPGLCLNLLDANGLQYLQAGYQALLREYGDQSALPSNGEGKELWKRSLDCAVVNAVHYLRASTQSAEWRAAHPKALPLAPYDTVRGAFWEGGPLYPGARIETKNHVQICVRNPFNILGYFRPILENPAINY